MKIKVHPLLFAAIPVYVLCGGVTGYLLAFLAVTIHELAHCLVARIAGARDLTLLLMPCGAALITKGDFPHFGAVLIAGPFANVFLAAITLSACWIIPELYGYLKLFISVNVVLAAINLLPAYPLDGGRLFRLLFPYPWARWVTYALTLIQAGGALVLFGVTLRVTYLIFGAFLLLSLVAILHGRRNRVRESDPLYYLARVDEEGRLRPAVVKRGRKTICRLTPSEVTALLLGYPSATPVGTALGERYK